MTFGSTAQRSLPTRFHVGVFKRKRKKKTTQEERCLQLGVPRGHGPGKVLLLKPKKEPSPVTVVKQSSLTLSAVGPGQGGAAELCTGTNYNQHLPALRHVAKGVLYSEGTSFLFFFKR